VVVRCASLARGEAGPSARWLVHAIYDASMQDTPPLAPATAGSLADSVAVTPGPVVRAARALALAGLLGLIVLGLAWELWLAPTGRGTLALKVLPLVLCVAGLLRHRMVIFRWLSLLVWLYFLEGVVRATSEQGMGRALAIVEIVLTLQVFVVCGFYIRWRLRSATAVAAAAPA
jgi:uncharacterized membrane protein